MINGQHRAGSPQHTDEPHTDEPHTDEPHTDQRHADKPHTDQRRTDQRHADERHAALREVACERCGAVVSVAKFSPQHTSVQWSTESVRACAEFSARVAAGEQRALIDTCTSLRVSIDRAVRDGRLAVRPP